MGCVAEVSSFTLMYNLCMYYEKQKSYDKTELTFQPTLVHLEQEKVLKLTLNSMWGVLHCVCPQEIKRMEHETHL